MASNTTTSQVVADKKQLEIEIKKLVNLFLERNPDYTLSLSVSTKSTMIQGVSVVLSSGVELEVKLK